MIDLKVGQYMYKLHGAQFRIYQCDCNDGNFSSCVPVMNEPFFEDSESARRRVYELNGWPYKPKKENEETPQKSIGKETISQRHNYYTKKGKAAALAAFRSSMYFSNITGKAYEEALEHFSYELDKKFNEVQFA